jgi:hypothetical protein
MYCGCQLFSLTLLVEVEESLLKRWVTLYALTRVWSRGESETHRCSSRRARCGEVMGVGAQCAHEWSAKIWPKASQVHDFLLPFIFTLNLCVIHFDRDRSSRLQDAVTQCI